MPVFIEARPYTLPWLTRFLACQRVEAALFLRCPPARLLTRKICRFYNSCSYMPFSH